MAANDRNKTQLTGPEKAAVLLMSLGEDRTSELWTALEDDEIRTVSVAMSRPPEIDAQQVQPPVEHEVAHHRVHALQPSPTHLPAWHFAR